MTSALQGAQTGTKVTVMSDHDTPKIRQPEPINITVLRVRNLKGQRGDQVNVLVKVEFGEKSLGESPKENCSPEAEAELNYSAHLTCSFDDPHSLNEISTKPVILTVIEVIPNEKKKSKKDEEKSVVLGQSTIDLMPLLQGETTRKLTLPIHPVAGSAIENLAADAPKPEVDVVVSVNEPLLSEEQLKDANLLSITVESVYSPPESWANQPAAYVYTAALPMPQSAEKEVPLVYAGGSLKPGIEKEVPNKQKKWAMPGAAEGGAVYIPDQVIAGDAIDDEDGDYRNKDDRDHRQISETDKNRVTWNIERRGYLDSSATKSLQDKIAKCRYWPLEVVRTNVPAAAKGKKEDDGHVGFHGVVYLDLAPLLYPGVRRIHGAYKIRPFNEHELLEKTNRKGSVADEAVKIAAGILSRSTASPFPKPAGKKEDAKGGKEPKKGGKGGKGADPPPSAMAHQKQEQVSTTKASDSASEAEGPVVNAEGMQYVEAKSYIKIDLVLHRPLVRKRPPEELATRVAEYIPPRPMFPKRTDGAQRAVEDFHNQIGVVGNLILDEFREQFGDALTALTSGHEANTQDDMETRRQKIIYHLNTSGKFFAFKEQLKHSVVKIVREKYLKTTTFKDKDELQAFLSDLYVYLLDQMHVGLNKVLSVEDQSPIPQPLTDSAQLKHFAREAEVNENFELATKYYQERIARDKSDPDTWMDYGTFCLYINDLTKAEECFKECVSIDQRHLYGLLLYGVVCTMQDKHESAETFFESATSFQPQSILAWTMLGLFYDGTGNEIGTEMALIEANKLNVAKAAEELRAAKEEEIRLKAEAAAAAESAPKEDLESAHPDPGSTTQEDPEPPGTAHTPSAASPREQSKAPLTPTSQASETKGAPKPAANKARPTSRTKSGKLLGNNKDAANSSRPESIHKSPAPAPATAGAPGEEGAHHEEHAAPEAIATPPVPTQTIFMHVVEWLLEVKAMPFTERALAHHLLDEAGGTSAEYYIAMARLQLQKHDMEEAEAALKAALAIDHQHPDGWAIMGHVKYLLGDTEVAKDCYERTLAFVADASEMHSIYLRLASIYLQENKYLEAKKTFLLACKRSPSCVSWLGVGIACYRLGELSEAEDALSEANILNNTDPEVWAYLSLVCLKTGRQLESEQAYKYAIKLNLPDEALLNELHEVQEEVGFGNPQL